jgi:hypothetical protein
MNRQQALVYLPPFRNHKDVVAAIGAGTNGQLVRSILDNYPRAVLQTRQLARRFDLGSLDASAQAVWDFLKHQIRYVEDSGLMQHMKLPNALVSTSTGDCKSYSLFAAGIMANLGYPVTFRFAGYSGAKHPGHVYILAGENPVIIDAVWRAYNSEKKPYSYKKDYPMEIATISGLHGKTCKCQSRYTENQLISGIGCVSCQQEAIGKIDLKKAGQKAKAAFQQAKKHVVQTAKNAVRNPLKTIFAAGPRAAFIKLVQLNIHDFARRLDRNRNAALKKWSDLGGIPGELNAAINHGQNRKPLLGLEGIGVAGETIAAVLAAATPIIIALAGLLGKGKTTELPAAPPPTGGDTVDQGDKSAPRSDATATAAGC